MRVLVTGGAGYVGSHAVQALVRGGHEVTVLDDLSSGHREAVDKNAEFVQGDAGDGALFDRLFARASFEAVMHFAAFIEVGESTRRPLSFYDNNVGTAIRLLRSMERHRIKRFVFSSTCAVYGVPDRMPLVETMPISPASPYARTKAVVEWALRDCADAWGLGYAALRYFNAAGAAGDGTIGEDHDPETHLIPNVLKVALGQRESVTVFGTDYPTPDGTCIRDYVHVNDLASAHVLVLESLGPGEGRIYNAGTGKGASVREVVETARRVTGHALPLVEAPRRAGDVPVLYADPALIRRELGWRPRCIELGEIVQSAWHWHRAHPDGFAGSKGARGGGLAETGSC